MTPEVWTVLGIAPTQDERAIRRAYADRLKQTNPEDRPEDFKILRAAYESALFAARWRRRDAAEAPEPIARTPDAQKAEARPEARREAPRVETVAVPDAADPAPRFEHLRDALETALMRGAPPARIFETFRALVQAPAMANVGVYVETEAWLRQLILETRPRSNVLAAPAMAYFNWDETANDLYRGFDVATMRDMQAEFATEAFAEGFVARMRDKRHEFHAPFRELAAAPRAGILAGIARAFKQRQVKRLLDFIDMRAPAALWALDADALAYWRPRVARTTSFAGRIEGAFKIVAALAIVAIVVASVRPDAPREAARNENPVERMTIADATGLCGDSIMAATPRHADLAACGRALRLAPDSLLARQYRALAELRGGDFAAAKRDFQIILAVAPLDPYALYGAAFADFATPSATDVSADVMVMRQAMALDGNVAHYFAQFELTAPDRLGAYSVAPPTFPQRPSPRIDVAPVHASEISPDVFAEAYRHFGLDGLEGTAVVECLVRVNGSVTSCRVVSEHPANLGLGELAVRIAQCATMHPGSWRGIPVDNVPVRVPLRFVLEDDAHRT